MKQCPHCSAEYGDSTNFCTKDGRLLVAKVAARTQLCPHCANSIAEDVVKCPYCKADLASVSSPEWPEREEEVSLVGQWPEPEEDLVENRLSRRRSKSSATSKVVLVAGVLLCALGLFWFGDKFMAREQPGGSHAMLERKIKEQQETNIKEQQEKDQKIQSLETQLAQVRQQAAESPSQLAAVKAKLEKSQKELSTMQERLDIATRELDESSRQRAVLKAKLEETQKELSTTQQRLNIATREASRPAPSRSQPAPASAQTPVEPTPPPPARRAPDPGTYETIRITTVHEDPSASSRVIAQLGKGTKLTVVKSVGNWLEVRSRHGKPPGYIRLDDAMYVSSAN